jgi:hypothetical protein
MEVLKNRLQNQSPFANTTQLIHQIYQKDGIRGFFKGYFLGLIVFLPYSVTFFVVYEKLKLHMHNYYAENQKEIPLVGYLSCSALAGATGALISNVTDIIKTRVQVSGQKAPVIIRRLFQENGIHAFTKGLGARLLYITPSVAISMAAYETFKRL